MKINLDLPKKIVIQPEKTKNITSLTVNRVVDIPKQKLVRCFLEEIDTPIVLWQGPEYDAIGQWTDSDVIERLEELKDTIG